MAAHRHRVELLLEVGGGGEEHRARQGARQRHARVDDRGDAEVALGGLGKVPGLSVEGGERLEPRYAQLRGMAVARCQTELQRARSECRGQCSESRGASLMCVCTYQLIADTVGVVTGGAEAGCFTLHQEESRNELADLGSKHRFGAIGLCARTKRQERSLEARSFVLLDTCHRT